MTPNCHVHLSGWAGRTRVPARYLGETPKRYRVQLLEAAYDRPTDRPILVPKWAVEFGAE